MKSALEFWGVEDGAPRQRGGLLEGGTEALKEGSPVRDRKTGNLSRGGVRPGDIKGAMLLKELPANTFQLVEGLIESIGGAEKIEGQNRANREGLQGFPDNELVAFGGELPMDGMKRVARTVISGVVVLTWSAAGTRCEGRILFLRNRRGGRGARRESQQGDASHRAKGDEEKTEGVRGGSADGFGLQKTAVRTRLCDGPAAAVRRQEEGVMETGRFPGEKVMNLNADSDLGNGESKGRAGANEPGGRGPPKYLVLGCGDGEPDREDSRKRDENAGKRQKEQKGK